MFYEYKLELDSKSVDLLLCVIQESENNFLDIEIKGMKNGFYINEETGEHEDKKFDYHKEIEEIYEILSNESAYEITSGACYTSIYSWDDGQTYIC